MPRAFILVLDSFGIGASADAASFGDVGADTLGSIARVCAEGGADLPGGRSGPLCLPNLTRLGLGQAAAASTGSTPPGLASDGPVTGAWGYAVEQSRGKDTPSGHWEMAGVPVPFDWGYFPRTEPCFPEDVVAALVERCGLPGILGNRHGSGTDIIRDLGDEHVRSGKPICYTSADSVFQIAAHEEHFGLQRLYDLCAVAKELLEPHNIARVIARPFVGDAPDNYTRTTNRRDLTTPPIADTLLDVLVADGGTVVSVGKIADIFAHRGISRGVKTTDNTDVVDKVLVEAASAPDRSLVFANLVDFDMLYGHRRDVAGYATALETFDARIPEIEAALQPDDMVLLTADHGCDPTWPGSDHTREHVPVLLFGPAVPAGPVGERSSFADMGQTLARHLGTPPLQHGSACFN